MKLTNTLPFISLLIIATMIIAPFIFAQDAWGGDAWAVTDSSWSGNSFGTSDWSWSGDSFAVNDNSWNSDASAASDSSWAGDSNAVSDSSWAGGSSAGTGSSYTDAGTTSTPTDTTTDTPSIPGANDFGEGPGGVPPGGPLPPPGPFPTNADAIWQYLPDITLYQGAPSGTILQKNVFSKCSDPDDQNLEFTIKSKSSNFELAFFGSDLRIYNLKTAFTGTERITLECSKVPTHFALKVIPRQITPAPATSVGEEGDEVSVRISAIRLQEESMAGEQVPILISFKNNGDKKLEDVKAAVVISELGVRASIGPFDLTKGKSVSKTIYVELPQDVQPGTYTARVTIDSGSLHRVKHRDVDVIA